LDFSLFIGVYRFKQEFLKHYVVCRKVKSTVKKPHSFYRLTTFNMSSNTTAESYQQCPRCGSDNLIQQVGKDEPTCHYGRLKCGDCGKHIQWLKDPLVTQFWNDRIRVIDEILNCHSHQITNWEREFLQSIQLQRRLSEKQQERFNAVGLKTLGRIICTTGEDYMDVFTIPKTKPSLSRTG
jgi:transcription elongation factor Elf1